MKSCSTSGITKLTYLLIDAGLLLFDLLLQPLKTGCIWSGTVCLQDLNISRYPRVRIGSFAKA